MLRELLQKRYRDILTILVIVVCTSVDRYFE